MHNLDIFSFKWKNISNSFIQLILKSENAKVIFNK